MIFGKISKEYEKKIKDLEKYNDKLQWQLEEKDGRIGELVKEKKLLEDKVSIRDDNMAHLEKEIEKLEAERDKLYAYYDINKEPTQDIKTAVRIDKRVHELELENIELRSRMENLTSISNSLVLMAMNNAQLQSLMNPMNYGCSYPIYCSIPYH